MREKRVHFWHTNRGRMALIVEEDEALDPVLIPAFRPSALKFEADGLANELKEFRYVTYRGPAL
jgi:hypothetical protein